MKKIKDFYNSLTETEKKLISKTLLKNARSSKSKDLLDCINNQEKFVDTHVAKNLYPEAPNSSYSHLKRRLKEKIIEIIYNHEISEQSDNPIFSDKAKCHKYLMQARLLIERGFKEEAKNYLKLAERIISERQFSIESFMLNLSLLEVNNLPGENLSISEKIQDDLQNLKELGDSKTMFHKLMAQGPGIEETSNNAMELFTHKNALSTYYKLSTDLNTCVGLLQYPQALRLSHQLTDHVHNFSKSFSQSEITQALLTHLRVLIYNKDFKAAIALSGKIQEPENLKFYMQTEFLMLKWLLYFCMRDYGKACTIYQSLSVLPHTTPTEKYKITYFKLCQQFQQGKYEDVTRQIIKNNALQSTGSPIPHAVKLLEIYGYLEQQKTDVAYSKLLAFKQYLKRNNTFNKERYQFIIKILFRLIRTGLQYTDTLNYYEKYREESLKNDGRFIPNLHHYELIAMEDWLAGKCSMARPLHHKTVPI